MSDWRPRRFWTEVAVTGDTGGHGLALDGRPVRTPGGRPLVVPTRAFAEVVAAEWAAVGDRLDPALMPATRLANLAVERMPQHRDAVIDEVAGYGGTDLLCYRADRPAGLVERQAAAWDPVLGWAAERFGARLATVAGVMPVTQGSDALVRLRAAVAGQDDFRLAALAEMVALSGSLVLGLAVADGWLTPEEAWSLSRLDEDAQAEEWGRDEEAEAAAALKREDFLRAARFHRLLDRSAGDHRG